MKHPVLRLFIVGISILFMSACVSTYVPPTPSYKLSAGDKVGILISAKDNPTHTHVGTTIFHNFTSEYEFDWGIKQAIFEEFKNHIEGKSPYQVVNLEDYAVQQTDLAKFVEVKDKKWSFTQANNELRESLLQAGIKAVILIEETPTLAVLECSAYGCSEHYSQGYGLFTRSFLGMDRYMASTSFRVQIETLDEPIDIMLLDEFRETQHYMSKHPMLEGFTDPQDFKQLTEEEMEPVKVGIVGYFSNLASMLKGFLEGSATQTNS